MTTMKMLEWIFDSCFKLILICFSAMTVLFLKENVKSLSIIDFSILTSFFMNNLDDSISSANSNTNNYFYNTKLNCTEKENNNKEKMFLL